MRTCRITLLACFLYICTAGCADSAGITGSNILFYASYDKGFNADRSAGNPRLQNNTTAEFTDGYKGRAVLTGSKGSELIYSTPGNCRLDSGSVSMWIKPVGWGESDSWMRFYFRLHELSGPNSEDSGNFLWLYKYFIYPVTWLTQQDTYKRSFYSITPGSGDRGGAVRFEWKNDSWANVIASWSGNQMSMYLNGQYVGSAYTPSPRLLSTLGRQFTIGGQNRNGDGVQDLAIDEVIVLDRPVTSGIAKDIYQRGMDAFKGGNANLDIPLLALAPGYNPSSGKAVLTTEVVGWRMVDVAKLKLNYVVESKAKAKILQQGSLAIKTLNQQHLISVKNIPSGEYVLKARLLQNTRQIASAETVLKITAKPGWVGNKIGKYSTVADPWTPMKSSGRNIKCWGREYTWENSAFPAQITSAGTKLLSSPITVSARISGKPCKSVLANFKILSKTDTRIDFTVDAKLGTVPLKVNGYVEFDGFMWCTATIGNKATGAVIERMTLEIPMNSDAVRLVNGSRAGMRSGALSAMSTSLGLEPVVWFGNEKCGLQWSCDNFRDWNVKDKYKLLSVEPAGKVTNIRFVLIDTPTALKGKQLAYSFGLQATPVKPMPAERRQWEIELARAYKWYPDPETSKEGRMSPTYFSSWAKTGSQPDGPYGRLQASAFTYEELDRVNPLNSYPYLYWNLGMLWNGEEVLQAFSNWGEYQKDAHPYTSIATRHWDPDMRDYMVWRLNRLFTDNPKLPERITGLYLDTSQAGWNGDTYSIKGTRDLQKRAYLSVKEKWPKLLFMNHESGSTHMFQLAFADMMLSGEHYTDSPLLIANLDYHELLDYDVVKSEFLGANFGIPLVFLPEIGRCVGTDAEKTAFVYSDKGIPAVEHLVGMLWVHDVPMLSSYVNPLPMIKTYRAKAAFGWDEKLVFRGYWDNSDFVELKSDKPHAEVSLFQRGDRVLFVVMNNSDEDASVTLTPDWKKLGIGVPDSVVDIYAEQDKDRQVPAVEVKSGSLAFKVKGRNFRALAMR